MTDEELDLKLRTEAAEPSPAFSQNLHERIMQRITTTSPAQSPRAAWRWPAIAAAVLLALGLSVYLKMHIRMSTPPNRVKITQAIPSVPPIHNPVQALAQPITEWNDAQYAYLDRDGQRVLGYMARQIDLMPPAR